MQCVVALSLLLAPMAGAQPVLVDRIVASVDAHVVTASMVDARMKQGAESRVKARDALIDELVIESECALLRITVESAEVDGALSLIAANNAITQDQLLAAAEQQGYDRATYRDSLRRQILVMRWVTLRGGPRPDGDDAQSAWLDTTRLELIAAARGHAAIDVREGQP